MAVAYRACDVRDIDALRAVLARGVLFLASDEARGMTGPTLIIDAGLTQTSAPG